MASGAKFALFGLEEFRDALRQLPADLNEEARAHVVDTVHATARELLAVYPVGPGSKRRPGGNLRRGVKTNIKRGRYETTGEVLSTAPHAHLWEFGTVNRRTRAGWNRGALSKEKNRRRGLYAIRVRRGAALRKTIVGILERGGFRVRGAA